MTQFNMVESPQGPDPKRLLLAVVATSAVLMVYSYFFTDKPAMPQALVPTKAEVKPSEALVEKPPEQIIAAHEASTKDQPLVKKTFASVAKTEADKTARTSYSVEVTNQGGKIDRYALTDFGRERILFDQEKQGSSLLKLSLRNPLAMLRDDAPYEIESSDASHIMLKHVTKEGLAIERKYQFQDHAVIKEEISFKNLSAAPIKVEPVLSASKEDENTEEPGLFNPGVQGQSLTIKASDKHQRFSYSDVLDKPKTFNNIKYVGFDDQFFLAAIVPQYSDGIENVELVVHEGADKRKTANIELRLRSFVLLNGEEKTISHEFFMGPKQVNLLSSLSVPLDENIDFGWFGVLSRPMLWLLVQIFGFVQNYGLAIILITFIIKLLTYPLTHKSFASQQEMKKLQPKIKEIQQKFGHDRTLLGQKQMELYRTHGINPVAGCLPLLIQLPIWFAFFQMLRNSVELFDQPFYWWIVDLTRPDQYYVLPVLMGASMLLQQAFTPPPSDQPHMKYVMWTMPIFLTFIMLNMPSGLSLYILTNNLLTILQQIIIKKRSEKISA